MPKNEFICDCHPIDQSLVTKTKAAMPRTETVAALSDFFSVIGNDTRCKILFALKNAPMCVCDLANVLSMTKSSVSHQLRKMKEAAVVTCEKVGKQVFYRLDDDHVFGVFELALVHIRHKEKEKRYEK